MPKHGKAFARAYIEKGRNGTAAARNLPGISEKSAEVIACRLLGNVKVQAEISRLESKLESRTLITRERIENELALIAFADMADYVVIGEEGQVTLKTFEQMPKDASRAVKSVEEVRRIMGAGKGDGEEVVLEVRTRYHHHDKMDALKELSKLKGYYPKQELPEGVTGVMFYVPNNGRD